MTVVLLVYHAFDQQVIDFTVPFWEESLGVAVKHIDRTASYLDGVFRPFSLWVWLVLLAATGVLGFLFWMFEYLTVTLHKGKTLAESFMACLFFVLGSFLNQGRYICLLLLKYYA